MKKLFTLAMTGVFALAAGLASAQSSRVAFVEEATQASCPPCATLNPALQDLMNDNPDNSIMISYQVWWPGFDQMYLDNSDEIDERCGDYYTYIFAPQVIMQGDLVTGSGDDGALGNMSQAKIDDINAEDSEFDIVLSGEVLDGMLTVTGSVTASMVADGDFKLRLMVTEDVIYYEDAPGGSNGETEYHHVFKTFIGGSAGIDLENVWAVNDVYTIDESIDLTAFSMYHYEGLEVIAIVQNDDDKFVHQAAKDHDVPVSSSIDNQVNNLEILNLPAQVCSGAQTITPSVKIMNLGNENLTTCDIIYSMNGEADQTYSWTGDLTPWETQTVMLDPLDYTAQEVNLLTTTTSNPNGVVNDNEDNVTQDDSFGLAPSAGLELEIVVNLDCYGSENSWEIKNSNGDVVADNSFSAGDSESEVVENITLDGSDCYTFHFYDTYGDGMNGSYWSDCSTDGSVLVSDANGNVVYDYDGSYWFTEDAQQFEGDATLAIAEVENISSFSIYPNPTSDVAHLAFNLVESKTVRVEVIDLLGKVVFAENFGQLTAGSQLIDVNANEIGSGLYIFNIYADDQKVSERVSIRK